ncbi:MAG: hypothetical protein WCR74_19275 [Betaproteobacteria bacterium]
MIRLLRHALLAFALLISQQAAQLHAMGHLGNELAAAARGEKGAPPAGHSAEQCLAFHALDSLLPDFAAPSAVSCAGETLVAVVALPLPFAPRIVFDSRAPPVLS